MYSDTQVTFGDGSTRDILQKTFPLGDFIAGGFAGSVLIGFNLLQSLYDFLEMPNHAGNQTAWDPVWVSHNWAPIAKSVFDSAPTNEKIAGSRFLMVGASPDEPCGLGSKIYFTRFADPDFSPKIMSRPIKFCSIGSGAGVLEYKHAIKPLFRLSSGILNAEIGQPNGWARQLGFSISRALFDYPHSGISKHIHIVIIRRGGLFVETNDENIYPKDSPRIEVCMPQVAECYEDFLALAKTQGHNAAGAVC